MANEMKITFTGGSLLGEERILPLDTPVLLGRSHSSDIRFKEADVSGRHLEIKWVENGVYATCLSKYGFQWNGLGIAEGESQKISPGDIVSLGTRARFRIDGISSGKESTQSGDMATFATRAVTSGGTVATQFVQDGTAGETFATRIGEVLLPQDFESAPRGSLEESPMTDSDSLMGVLRPPIAPPAAPSAAPSSALVDDTPTADDSPPDVPLSPHHNVDAPADFSVPADEAPTGTDTSLSGGGETQEMKTRQASMDEIFRMKRMLENKKRFRQKLIAFAALVFLSVVGTIIFVNWPREEKWLSHPCKAGSKEIDLLYYLVKADDGSTDIVIDYPNSPHISKTETKEGLEVTTNTGKKRNVPFRLSFFRRTDNEELGLSLIESARRIKAGFEKRGYSFFVSEEGSLGEGDAHDGVFFFENENPTSCDIKTQRGTRFFRSEYRHEDKGMKWHGYLILLRDGPTAYTLMREIPEDVWPRGKDLLRIDANIELGAAFLNRRWESPGRAGLIDGVSEETLHASFHSALESCRPVDWPRMAMEVDTLMARSYLGSDAERKKASDALKSLCKLKDVFYLEQKNRYDDAKKNNDEDVMRAAFEKCRGAFGCDTSDRRNCKLNNPKEWSCRLK